MENKSGNEHQEIISAIFMDNTMAKDALKQKNYHAVFLALERQETEIKRLIDFVENKYA